MDHEVKVVSWFNAIDWIQAGSRIVAILIVSGILIFIARRLIAGFERFTAMHAYDIGRADDAPPPSAACCGRLATFMITTLATLADSEHASASRSCRSSRPRVSPVSRSLSARRRWSRISCAAFSWSLKTRSGKGDVVEIAGKTGQVESLTLRYVQLRDYEGNVHYVPNGEIGVVTNSSRTFAFAVMDVIIALDQEIAPVIDIMREIGVQLRAHSEFGPKILDELEIAGIETWNERGITLRARVRVHALDQATVRREFLLRLKHAFDKKQIRQPQMTVMLVGAPAAARRPPATTGKMRRAGACTARRPLD